MDFLEALDRLEARRPELVGALVLRDVCQLEYAEIAAYLGVPEGTVKSRIHQARADVRDHPIRFDSAVIETTHVEQHATVAQVTGRPAVPSRPYADSIVLRARIAERYDHVVGVMSLHNHVGKAVRQQAVPHRLPTSGLVSFRAAKEELLHRKQDHRVPLTSAAALAAARIGRRCSRPHGVADTSVHR